MGTRGLPDIYTLGPWALGVYIKLTLLQGCTHKMDVQYQFPLLFLTPGKFHKFIRERDNMCENT